MCPKVLTYGSFGWQLWGLIHQPHSAGYGKLRSSCSPLDSLGSSTVEVRVSGIRTKPCDLHTQDGLMTQFSGSPLLCSPSPLPGLRASSAEPRGGTLLPEAFVQRVIHCFLKMEKRALLYGALPQSRVSLQVHFIRTHCKWPLECKRIVLLEEPSGEKCSISRSIVMAMGLPEPCVWTRTTAGGASCPAWTHSPQLVPQGPWEPLETTCGLSV